MIKYDIYVNQMRPEIEDRPGFGIEIRPPVSDRVAEGICQALANLMEPGDDEPSYLGASVTRNDEAGTALMLYPNYDTGIDFEPDNVGVDVTRTINPLNSVETETHLFVDNEPY